MGAIFIDRGYSFASSFVLKLWKQRLKKTNVTILDSKTSLQEYSLKHYKKLPLYRLISSFGPKHNPTFKISVSIQNSKQFFGTGNSKQRAELDAANKLLKTLKLD